MEVILLNKGYAQIGILDVFNSLIWTDRYYAFGDFEITTSPNSRTADKVNVVTALIDTEYIKLKESEHLMAMEIMNIHSDQEKGASLIFKGRSIETILDRRIMYGGKILSGNFQDSIELLLNENFIYANNMVRIIPNFTFLASEDPDVTSVLIDTQVPVGASLYKVISDLCKSVGIGFKITLTDSNEFLFQLYSGKDRSYDQLLLPHVVFSPKYDNLISGDYVETNQYVRNSALVGGEKGVGNERTLASVDLLTPEEPHIQYSGLERREIFVESNDVSRSTPDGGELTEAEYISQLEGVGRYELAKNQKIKSFEGQVDTTMYNYGDEFFMGDIVQVEDEYGHETTSRVVELIRSQDENGIKVYPTFATLYTG